MRKKRKAFGLIGLCLLLVWGMPQQAWAKEMTGGGLREEETMEIIPEDMELSELNEILKEGTGNADFSMEELAALLLEGRWKEAFQSVLEAFRDTLFSEIETGKNSAARILLLAAISAFFVNMTASFQNQQVSETGFYVSYMLLSVLLFTGASEALGIAERAVELLFTFMAALLPVFFVAVAAAGGSVTAMGFYQLTFFSLTMVQWCFLYVFLPGLKLYVVLVVLNSLTKEEMLSGFTGLLENLFSWGLKTMTGLVLGLHVIQGMVLPFADSLQNSVFQKLLGILPGLGSGAEAIAQTVIGSGTLIKNGLGMAAVAAMAVLCLVPLCKLGLLCLFYQAAGAFSQPVSDKRLLSGIQGTAKGMGMAARLLLSAMLLFVLTIAMVCAFTNTAYFAG